MTFWVINRGQNVIFELLKMGFFMHILFSQYFFMFFQATHTINISLCFLLFHSSRTEKNTFFSVSLMYIQHFIWMWCKQMQIYNVNELFFFLLKLVFSHPSYKQAYMRARLTQNMYNINLPLKFALLASNRKEEGQWLERDLCFFSIRFRN